jgi:hypothetical protein
LIRGARENREIKDITARFKSAKSLQDLIEPGVISSAAIAPDQLIALVTARARRKAQKYGGGCSNIDLHIYLNLKARTYIHKVHFPKLQH